MKILFAVSNENIAEAIKKEYQNNYKEQLTTKNVYYFNAIIKELQNNKTYDVVIISEDLEPFANNNYDTIDKFLAEKLLTIREEAVNAQGVPVPVVFITTDRHILGDFLTSKLFEIGIYNALVGNDRSIENVCTLMFHPRKKQEARNYYRVNVELDKSPKEDDVKEEEIKSIIAHYKQLGKAEERYVESFDNIVSQYNDAQLKIIIRFLPLNVKAVLEAQSPKYQSLTTFANNYNTGAISSIPKAEIKEKSAAVDTANNRVLEQISSIQNNSKIIVPNAMNVNKVRKIEDSSKKEKAEDKSVVMNRRKDDEHLDLVDEKGDDFLPGFDGFNFQDNSESLPTSLPGVDDVFFANEENVQNKDENILPGFEDEKVSTIEEPVVKRGRGRPKKIVNDTEKIDSSLPKRGRGRPKKNVTPVVQSFEDKEKESDDAEGVLLPGFFEEDDKVVESSTNDIQDKVEDKQDVVETYNNPIENIQKTNNMSEKQKNRYENIEYLIPADKKVVTFVGTSKSGVSFIVNNLAQMLSSLNINVAILDMTTNRNSFYIYTNNDESLRNKATNSIYNLVEGKADGIRVNKNLTVYTSLPTDNEKFYEADKVLKTLIDNHSVILVDCDYETPIGYFDNSTDMFLVQNMDILTMQPLTTFLKELKSKEILKDEKLRLIVNMEAKVKGVNPQVLLNAVSVYKDPGMAYTVELFERTAIKLFSIPFDTDAYNKYLTTLVDCNLSLNGYSKSILVSLKEIATCIYPLMSTGTNGKNKKNTSYMPPSLNNYSSVSPFGANTGNTLNQMKNRY